MRELVDFLEESAVNLVPQLDGDTRIFSPSFRKLHRTCKCI